MAKAKKSSRKKPIKPRTDFHIAQDLRSPEAIKEWEENQAAMQRDADLHARKRQESLRKQKEAYLNTNTIVDESERGSKPVHKRVSKKAKGNSLP